MTAREFYQAGDLVGAIQSLSAELRDNPGDAQKRTFLFELLCFSGDFDRAEKQLDIVGRQGGDAGMGSLIYRAALHSERMRNDLFQKEEYPKTEEGHGESSARSGTWNGHPFQSFTDADPRIGARLEVSAGGQYLWLPFEHIASIEMEPPRRLRDLVWAPAVLKTGPEFSGTELGEVLLPVLAPFSWKRPNDAVRLGRLTEWEEQTDGQVIPFGQKMFLIDDQEVPILELRRLEFTPSRAAKPNAAT